MPKPDITEKAPTRTWTSVHEPVAIPPVLLQSLFSKAKAPPEWNLTPEEFARALERSAGSRFKCTTVSPQEIADYLSSLHLGDLALACACSEGNESAWEFFIRNFRHELYRAGRAIAGDPAGREIADSLFGELFGLEERDGQRRSLLRYFHGRSKLGTWLRAVLAQRHVDELRRTRHSESLDDPPVTDNVPRRELPSKDPPADPERARYLALLQAALSQSLAALAPRDRLRLCCYYIQDLTLAQTGRLLGEHEATAKRKIDRTRQEIRERVDAALRLEKRLSDAQVRLCYEYAQQEWPFDLMRPLSAPE